MKLKHCFSVHSKSKRILNPHNWYKQYCDVNLGLANWWIIKKGVKHMKGLLPTGHHGKYDD